MELKTYAEQTKKLTVPLKGGDLLNLVYFPNYLTIEMMEAMDKLEDSGATVHRYNVAQCAKMLSSVDMTLNGKKVAFNTDAEKIKTLSHLSAQDLTKIIRSIQEDIAEETKNDSTDSVDG